MNYLYYWLSFAILGTFVLYVGYGFTMAAVNAKDKGLSSKPVFYVDCAIALFFGILDLLLNLIVYSVICLDFRPKYWFTTISWRMTFYNQDENEWRYRRAIAAIFEAFLDGKDPSEDHIRGKGLYLKFFKTLKD